MKTFHRFSAGAILALAGAAPAFAAAPLLSEGFDDIGGLSGWQFVNHSAPVGASWFQGNAGVFGAQAGAADSYIGASFLSAAQGEGTLDNWLITPELHLNGSTVLTFYSRGAGTPGFNDTLEVRFSSASGGGTAGFTQTLATVGGASPYPDGWQRYTATIDGGGMGRFAFHYTGSAANADYIGIDSVSVAAAVPEPSTYALFGAGLALLGFMRRKNRRGAALALGLSAAALGLTPAVQAAEQTTRPALEDSVQQPGAIAVRDAETGQLRAPTPAEAKALQPAAQKRAALVAPQVRVKPDGTRQARVGETKNVYSVLTRDADGTTHMQCVTGEAAAETALSARAVSPSSQEHEHAID